MTIQRIAELEAEVMRLREALEVKHDSVESLMPWCVKNVDKWDFPQYYYLHYAVEKMKEALSTPFTPTALNELIEKVEKMTIERCADHVFAMLQGTKYDNAWAELHDAQTEIRALPVGQIKLKELL